MRLLIWALLGNWKIKFIFGEETVLSQQCVRPGSDWRDDAFIPIETCVLLCVPGVFLDELSLCLFGTHKQSISPVSLLTAAHRVLGHCRHADSWLSCSKDKLSLTARHKWRPGALRAQRPAMTSKNQPTQRRGTNIILQYFLLCHLDFLHSLTVKGGFQILPLYIF